MVTELLRSWTEELRHTPYFQEHFVVQNRGLAEGFLEALNHEYRHILYYLPRILEHGESTHVHPRELLDSLFRLRDVLVRFQQATGFNGNWNPVRMRNNLEDCIVKVGAYFARSNFELQSPQALPPAADAISVDEIRLEVDDEFRVLRVNHAFFGRFSFTLEQIRNQPLTLLFSPSSHNRLVDARRQMVSGKRMYMELDVEACAQNGHQGRVLVKISRKNPDQQPPVFSVVIREYANLQDTRNIISLISMALESIDEGIVIFEPVGNGAISFVNQALEKLTGYPRHLLFGRPVFTLMSNDMPAETAGKILEDSVSSGWKGELTFQRKNGEFFPGYISTHPVRDEFGNVAAVVAVIQDVSRQKEHQRAIISLQRFIEQIINNLHHYIFVTDEESRILFWNEALARDFGIMPSQAVGKKLLDVLPELNSFYYPALFKELSSQGSGLSRKKFMRFGQTENRYYRITVTAQTTLNNKASLLWVIQDIHDEEILKEQITWQNARLQFLDNLTNFLNAVLDFDTILQTLASKLYEIVPFHEMTVLMPVDEERKTFQLYYRTGNYPEEFPGDALFHLEDSPLYHGVVVPLKSQRFQVRSGHHALKPFLQQFHSPPEQIAQVLSVPIHSSNELLGILNLAARDAHFFSREDVSFIEQVVGHLAIALKNSLHLEYIELQNKKLQLVSRIYQRIRGNPSAQKFLDQALEEALSVFELNGVALYAEVGTRKMILRAARTTSQLPPGSLPLHLSLADGALEAGAMVVDSEHPAPAWAPILPALELCHSRFLLVSTYQAGNQRRYSLFAMRHRILFAHRRRTLMPVLNAFLEEVIRAQDHLVLFQKIKAAQEEWQTTFDAVPIALAVLNERFQVVQLNREFRRWFSIQSEEDLKHTENLPIPLFQSLLNRPEPPQQWIRDLRSPRQWQDAITGRVFVQQFTPLFEGKSFIGGILTIRDITEERKKDEHIRYLSRFPEINPNLVMSLKKDGSVVYMNPSSLRLLVEHHATLQEERQLVPEEILERVRSGEMEPGHPFQCLHKIEDRVFQMIAYLPEEDDNVYVYGIEITDRLKLQQQLIQTERVRAMGEVAAGVAHDFNNLLTTILGRTQLLLLRAEDSRTEEELRIIEKAARDGSQIVKRMQEMTRQRRESNFQPCYLSEILRDSLMFATQKMKLATQVKGRTIQLNVNLDDSLVVYGNPIELKEVFTNLFFNAYDAMPNGGVLRVSTQKLDTERVQVVIQDTGMGIPPELKHRIFEPFFTTKGERGTGMGLSLVYNIVTAHHGSIEVESQPGKGSTFYVELPISRQKPRRPDRDNSPAPRAESANLRLLIVDDEQELLDTLGEILELRFKEVFRASSGKEALALCETHRFDVVLTDLGMPEMSGWEVAREVKARHPETFTILVTGWGMQAEEELAQHSYVDKIISKPYDLHTLIQFLNSLTRAENNSIQA